MFDSSGVAAVGVLTFYQERMCNNSEELTDISGLAQYHQAASEAAHAIDAFGDEDDW